MTICMYSELFFNKFYKNILLVTSTCLIVKAGMHIEDFNINIHLKSII